MKNAISRGLMAAGSSLLVTLSSARVAYAHVDGTDHQHQAYDDPVFMIASVTTIAIIGVLAAWRYFHKDH